MTSRNARNVLFIMCDQLRHDYLGCYGHPTLKTPNIDRLAARGLRFSRAYVQSTICGPSRMSAYTGRYVRSHGSSQNGVPLRIGEPTLGSHLREIGIRTVLAGKTHMRPDEEGMRRLGIDPASPIGVETSQCGFEPFERDDGLHPGTGRPETAYDRYLRDHGFAADNPWEYWAASAGGPDGTSLDGWLLSHADKPARIPAEHSETAYMTDRAMDFMRKARRDPEPWCLHLSYIKPHWPYIVPAPYHGLYGPDDVVPVLRGEAERTAPHPLHAAFQNERHSRVFASETARRRVIACYMGLITQIDDQIGRLLDFMEAQALLDNTMIVFTSDHGDYLGDHWLGEKQMFHDASVRVPLIVCDPAAAADTTRGGVSDALVEMIDLAPTFLEFLGGDPKPHVLEGRSLLPLLHGRTVDWRRFAISEYDYAWDTARLETGRDVQECRMVMVVTRRWKYVHVPFMRPILFDLENDPAELEDLATNPACGHILARMQALLVSWYEAPRNRITVADDVIARRTPLPGTDPFIEAGIKIGYWDEKELREQLERQSGSPLRPG
ncbi:MAG: alkaline phosphatase family protein [Rhizobiaceae bacterium]|nr:alkaline phosphatase family protein [Rhizobiaceae bacterium]